MDKLEKVIKGLECCTSGGACKNKDCPYIKYQQAEWCKLKLDEDALELLKEYATIKETISDGIHETAKMFRRTAGDNEIPLKW